MIWGSFLDSLILVINFIFRGDPSDLFVVTLLTFLWCLLQSVVLVSRLPFVALFNQLVGIIAPEYFDNGEPSLEAGNISLCFDLF